MRDPVYLRDPRVGSSDRRSTLDVPPIPHRTRTRTRTWLSRPSAASSSSSSSFIIPRHHVDYSYSFRDTSFRMIASAMHRRLLRATGPATSCRPTRAQNRFVCRAANIDVADMSALKPKKGTFCCTRRAASHAAQGASCGLAPLPVSQGIPLSFRSLPAPLSARHGRYGRYGRECRYRGSLTGLMRTPRCREEREEEGGRHRRERPESVDAAGGNPVEHSLRGDGHCGD